MSDWSVTWEAQALSRLERENAELLERIGEACDLLAPWGGAAAGLVPAIRNLKGALTDTTASLDAAEEKLAQVTEALRGIKSYLGAAGQDADHVFIVRQYIDPALAAPSTVGAQAAIMAAGWKAATVFCIEGHTRALSCGCCDQCGCFGHEESEPRR